MSSRMLFLTVALLTPTNALAEDLWLASGNEFPGRLRLSEGGVTPRVVFSRRDRPDPAYPDAIMKIGQIAVSRDKEIYYCSGLDGSLMRLLDGRHEIQPFTFPGQIRDLACTAEAHTVYFSVVATPQNGQRLADGFVYRRDLWEGAPQLVATIAQSQVGGAWWGTFAIRDGELYLVTTESPSKIYCWSAGSLNRVFPENKFAITGLTVGPSGEFLFVDGGGAVRKTRDFVAAEAMLRSALTLTDVAHTPPGDSDGQRSRP